MKSYQLLSIKHHTMKTGGGVKTYLHTSFTLVLDGDELSASCPGRFTGVERVPGTHWIGGWVGLRTGRNKVVKRKVPLLILPGF